MLGSFCFEIHQPAAVRNSSETHVDTIRITRPRREGVTAASTSCGGCSNSSGRCSSSSVLVADVGKRFLHLRRLGDLVFLFGLELVGLLLSAYVLIVVVRI